MKKNLGIIIISFLFLTSCSKHIPAVFEVTGMYLSNSNNTLEKPFDAWSDSIPKKAYAIRIHLDEVMKIKRDGDANENGFENEDKLISLNIYSLNNFDGSHLAGASLNNYFLTALSSNSTVSNFISAGKIGGGLILDNNYADSWSTDQYLFLMTAPSSIGNYSFVVNIGMSDGRTMCDTVTVRLY